jgi:phage protein D
MPEPVYVSSESAAFGDFRVPHFKVIAPGVVTSEGSHIVRDVVQITYKDNLKEIDGFELTINNWNADNRQFKFVGSETASTLQAGAESARYRLFEPSNQQFEIQMGYVHMNPLRTMVLGDCTTLEPNFPSGGGSTLNGRGLNVLHRLRRKQYSDPYPNKRPSEIAREISHKNDPQTGRRRFPIPIHVDPAVLSHERPIEYISQQNQYDIDFLFQLARRVGYVVYLSNDQRTLFFGPSTSTSPQALRQVTYRLKRGVTLVDFKPTLNAANQVKSVTLRGSNRAGQRIHETVTLNDPQITVNHDLLEILRRCDPREEVVVNEPVRSSTQAHDRALAILLERYKEFVTATGTTVGLPDLRAGMQVLIEGIGSRFSGLYFVTESTHTINDSGYLTRFTARREDPGTGAV